MNPTLRLSTLAVLAMARGMVAATAECRTDTPVPVPNYCPPDPWLGRARKDRKFDKLKSKKVRLR